MDRLEYGVDARYSSKEEQQKDAQLLREVRRSKMAKLSKQDILHAKLMRLKLRILE